MSLAIPAVVLVRFILPIVGIMIALRSAAGRIDSLFDPAQGSQRRSNIYGALISLWVAFVLALVLVLA